MLRITLRQLECLCAAAEEGSVSAAAESLHLTQSTVSQHLALLEETLGTQLLIRGARRKTELTPAGRKVCERAGRILHEAGELENGGEEAKTVLSIAASTVPSRYLLPRLTAGFAAAHPGVNFRLFEGDSVDVADKLLTGEARLGFLGSREMKDGLSYRTVASDELVLITPPEKRFLAYKDRPDAFLNILYDHPLISREEGSGTQRSVNALLDHLLPRGKKVRVVARMNSPEMVIAGVMNGMGVAIVSRLFSAAEEKEGKLLAFTPENVDTRRFIYLAQKTGTALTREERLFKEYVLARDNLLISE